MTSLNAGLAAARAPSRSDEGGHQVHRLSTGTLRLSLPAAHADDPPFRIAERINPKRAFLFVSTLLGRHIPVDPRAHRAALVVLADWVRPQTGSGPVLVMGFAETAVGLGAGIWDELRRAEPARAITYLPTTRYRAPEQALWFVIEESHSHAVDHMILHPEPGVVPAGPDATLVIVDDETTTGQTFARLAGGLAETGLRPARVVLVTLTDWSGGAAETWLSKVFPEAAISAVSLLAGRWEWAPDAAAPQPGLPGGIPPGCPLWVPRDDPPFGAPRRGLTGLDRDGQALLADLRQAGLAAEAPGDRVLVIGSGEHVWQAQLLAEALAEGPSASVRVIATTRSPILPGETIRRKLTFPDHYGEGYPMYLHNVDPNAWDRIILLTETGRDGVPADLLAALPGVELVDGDGAVHRPGGAP